MKAIHHDRRVEGPWGRVALPLMALAMICGTADGRHSGDSDESTDRPDGPREKLVSAAAPAGGSLGGLTNYSFGTLANVGPQLLGSSGSLLFEVDPDDASTNRLSDHGLAGLRNVEALAYRSSTAVYAIDNFTDELIRINRFSGEATVIGATGYSDVEGLAWSTLR